MTVLKVLLTGAGVAFIVLTLRSSLAGGWQSVFPSAPRFVSSMFLIVGGLIAAGASWRALLSPSEMHSKVTRGFYLAILAKYVPGGIWQPIGQVGFATMSGIQATRALAALSVHALILAISGAVLGSGVATTSNIPSGWRSLAIVALGSVLLLYRRWMVATLELARRFIGKLPTPDQLPSQTSILLAFVWNTVGMALICAAFSALVGGHAREGVAFAAAWTIGYLVLPVPSGVGVREAVLIGLLGLPTSVVLSAAIAHRVAQLLAEVSVAVAAVVNDRLIGQGIKGRSR